MTFSEEQPIFLQVAEQIESEIIRGLLLPDEQVYSTNELSKIFNINPNTAAKSLSHLMSNEIIYKKRGIGMFVSTTARQKILDKRKEAFLRKFLDPCISEAKILGISKIDMIKLLEEKYENADM